MRRPQSIRQRAERARWACSVSASPRHTGDSFAALTAKTPVIVHGDFNPDGKRGSGYIGRPPQSRPSSARGPKQHHQLGTTRGGARERCRAVASGRVLVTVAYCVLKPDASLQVGGLSGGPWT